MTEFLKDKTLWAVFFTALLLRGLCVLVAGSSPGAAINMDSNTYVVPARNILRHHIFASGEWPDIKPETERTPGYSVFLIPFLKADTLNVVAVQWAQVLLGALTVCLVYLITGYVSGSPKAATIAGIGLAMDSVAIAYTPIVLTETSFLFLWTMSLFFLLKGTFEKNRAPKNFILSGLLLGIASLVRPVSVYYFIFVLPFLLLGLRRIAARQWRQNLLIFFIAALAIPLAWTVRNGVQSSVYTFSSIQSENLRVVRAALLEMNISGKSFPESLAYLDAEFQKSLPATPLSSYQISAARGVWSMKFILSHPVDYAKFLSKDFIKLLAGNSVKALTWLFTKDPDYDPWTIPLHNPNSLWKQANILFGKHPLCGVALVFYGGFFLAVYLGAMAGIVFLWREKGPAITALLASPAIYIILVTVGAASQGRYRLPAMPCLFMLAGIGFQRIMQKQK